jgi:hypothetical protein
MGEAPSTCNNRYDGTITSFLVTYPGGTLNPITTPNGTFTLYGDGTYNVTLTIRTQAQNSNQNTLGGTTWYDENLFGYYFGVCFPSENGTSIGPSEDVNISINDITHPCCSGYTVYRADFSTFSQLQSPVSFQINWEPVSTTSATSTTTSVSNTISIAHAISASSTVTTMPTNVTVSSTVTTSTNVTASIDSTTTSIMGSLSENSTKSTLAGAHTLAMSSFASYSSAPGSLETNSSRASTTGTINRSSSQPLTATDVLAVVGLGAAAVYAVGWAMIRRLR